MRTTDFQINVQINVIRFLQTTVGVFPVNDRVRNAALRFIANTYEDACAVAMRCVNARHNNAISRDSRILISAINSLRHRTSAWVDSGGKCGDSLNSGNGFECRCGRVVFAWKQKWKKKGSRNDYIAGLSLANWSLVLLFLDVRDWALLELASRSNRARAE